MVCVFVFCLSGWVLLSVVIQFDCLRAGLSFVSSGRVLVFPAPLGFWVSRPRPGSLLSLTTSPRSDDDSPSTLHHFPFQVHVPLRSRDS